MELDALITQIKLNQNKWLLMEDDKSLLLTIFNNKPAQERSISELKGAFLESQVLIDHLLRIKPTEADKNELISVCRQYYHNDNHTQTVIRMFQQTYSCEQIFWWYTKDTFLYRMLNKALRVQDIHLLFLFRFVIQDLWEQLKKYQYTFQATVYRGQYISKDELEELKRSKGQLISTNSFLSTTFDHQLALSFIPEHIDLERVLFQIDANPQLDGIKPFAKVDSFSCFPRETEVLFMLGSIFRLDNIDCNQDRVWTVRLTLCSAHDHDFKLLYDYFKNSYCRDEPDLVSFANVLRDMEKIDEAEKYYWRQLTQLPSNDYRNIAVCFYSLGTVAFERGEYQSSLKLFQKSLEIEMQILMSDDSALASTYNCIGNVYCELGDYEDALKSYNKAVRIFRGVSGEDHFQIANYFNNLGVVHFRKQNWLKALKYFLKALILREKHLPINHPWLGSTHNNIGIILDVLGYADLALKQHNHSLHIYSKSISSQQSDVGMTLYNIGTVHEKKGDFNEAILYYKKAADIYRYTLPSIHPYNVQNEKNIQRVLSQLK